MKKIMLVLVLLSGLVCAGSALAGTIQFKGSDGSTEFSAVGKPAMIKINGKGEGPEGTLTYLADKVSGTIKVQLDKLTTEIDMRDEHMKNKYLEVKKFPTADLTLTNFKTPVAVESLTDKEIEMPFTADFTLHGKTKSISGVVHVKKNQKKILGDAEFSVKIMEYLETLPSFAGVKIAEDVKVKIKINGTIQ